MSKPKTIFICQSCGTNSPKWLGKCSGCGEWNTFVEETLAKKEISPINLSALSPLPSPQSILDLQGETNDRIALPSQEFNRVLGGGAVPGSVILIGGDPGIGKSTLLLQVLNDLSQKNLQTLYISGEESGQQIRLRAKRIGSTSKNLMVLTETCVERILQTIQKNPTDVICIDSVQTMYSQLLEAAAGSISQIRMVSAKVIDYAKKQNCITFLVGHVTKEGSLAGPRVLEHMVDTVLYFEGGKNHPYRILRTSKNRFGSTNEIGVFEMTSEGLKEVKNPSELFLSERIENHPGSVVTVTVEGTRPILVEVQSLTLPCYGGPPRRTCIGIESNRVSLLAAVIQRELNKTLTDQDLYVNIVGGIKIMEPAADLGLVASMISSRMQIPSPKNMVFFGEVGLTGEVRAIQQPGIRIKEAEKLGFSDCVLPKGNLNRLTKDEKKSSIKLTGIHHIREITPLLNKRARGPTLPSKELSAQA